MMKRFVLMFAAFGLLFACTPEENNTGDNNGNDGTVHVTGISLDRPTATIKEGESITLVATVTPANADNKNVTWSTSSEAVATVDNNGKVTGVKAGSATITAMTEDGAKKATCALSVEANLAPSVTVESSHVSAISVVLAGKANLGSTVASDISMGIMWSVNSGVLPSNSTKVEATNMDGGYNYSVGVTGLTPETTYYFRSFVTQNGQDTYGETKEFTTKDIASLLETNEASDVEATKATLNAKLDLTDVQYKSLAYGFLWGSSESALNTDFKCTDIKDNAISASLTSLPHKTQYWYKAYVKIDSQTFYGEVKTFTTDVVPVESVSLDKTEYTFHTIGNTLTLNATVFPSDATDKSVEWSSDKEDVATVDQNGKVTAKANGNAIITVTTKDQGKTASCEVTVAQWVMGITLDKSSVTLNEGEYYTLIPTVNPDNAAEKKLAWISSDESIATVDQTGKVTAVSKGAATITATATDGSGKYASCSVTVKRLVSSIQLNKTTLTLYRGGSDVTETLTATVNPSTASNTSVTWTSSNTTVATVSSFGMVTGKSGGTAAITVTANDGSGVSATCQVEVKQCVTTITLSQTSLSLVIGEEETISVTSVLPDNANDKTYTWSSSDNMIATVDNSGKVTAKAKGNTVIMAMANDGRGVTASCEVTVSSVCPDGAVDLGLTTSKGYRLYWATCNLSKSGFVSSPEAYGDYYAWGETEPKSNYPWSTYKFGTSSSGPFSKYNTQSSYGSIDNKTVLEPEDDAAHVKLGGNWRMPSYEEWTELITKCTWTWVTDYNGTGINGRLVTATNGNSIFLPAAGNRYDSYLNKAGSFGGYWSSFLRTDYPYCARYVNFGPDNVSRFSIYRYYGQSVRPVSE